VLARFGGAIVLLALSCASLSGDSIYTNYFGPSSSYEVNTLTTNFLPPGSSTVLTQAEWGLTSLAFDLPFQYHGSASGTGVVNNAVGDPCGNSCTYDNGSGGYSTNIVISTADSYAGGEVDPALGIMRAQAWAAAAETKVSYVASADSTVGFGDTLTLSKAGTITLSGSLDGSVILNGSGGGSWELFFAFFNPLSLADCTTDGPACYGSTYGGVDILDPNIAGSPAVPFSTSISLPEGNTTLVAWLELMDGAGEGSSGVADEQFINTLQFSITPQSGVTVDSLLGIPTDGPVSSSPVPEPSSWLLAASAIAAVLAMESRRRRKAN